MTSLRLLQSCLAALSIIPIVTGAPSLLRGLPRSLSREPGFAHLDSEHRFRAAVWTSFAVGAWLLIPSIQSQALMLRFLMGAIFFGGLARLWSLWRGRYAFAPWLVGPLFAELVAAPLIVVWQARLTVAG